MSFDPLEPVEVLDRLPEELRALIGTDLNSPMVYELLSFVCQVAKEECEHLEEISHEEMTEKLEEAKNERQDFLRERFELREAQFLQDVYDFGTKKALEDLASEVFK